MAETNKKAILGLSLGHFTADLYSSALIPLYPLIMQTLGITLANISLIISLGHLVSSVFQPLFGYYSDKMKRRAFMINGLIMGAVFIPLTIIAPTPVLFCLCLMLGMCGNSLFHPQVTSLVKTFCYNNPNVSKFMGIFMGLGTIGYALGPFVSSGLIEKFGKYSLLYITVLGLTVASILYFAVPKIPENAINKSKESFLKIMKEILKNKTCMLLALMAIAKSAVTISFGTYIPFILKEQGFKLNSIGLVVTLFYLMSGFSMIASAKLEEKIGATNLLRVSFLTPFLLVFLFWYLIKINVVMAIIPFLLAGFFINLSVSITIVAAQKIMSRHSGVISGVMQGFSWGMGALSLAPLGYIGQKFGVIYILFIMSAVAFLVGIFGLTKDVKIALDKRK